MVKKIKKALSAVTALCMVASATITYSESLTAEAASSMTVEYLDRGITAINTGSGMMVSWRYLANDSADSVYKLYRNNTLIYTSNAGNATCYLDSAGKSSDTYKVETLSGGSVVSTDTCKMITNSSYFNINLDVPKAGSDYTYSPNDCSVGDVDGDGQYELFVKWDPSNSKDNSQSGVTGNVYIDCYRLDSTKLWRIDLGKNIRAGAHYTQFLVADFDLDGKAEMTCKTADGTIDGTGKVIGDSSKDYRNSSGYVLSGPEYYTLFDGATGKALDTVDYEYPRGEVSKSTWGDNYGNRVDRFLGAVMYCDGVKPSAVSVRGYYTRMTAVAYDVVDDKLVKRWGFDTGYNSSAAGYGDGNHNCMPADVDNDGKQELVLGAVCLDDNGKVLWNTNKGHGDAMHLSDLLPDRNGLELWVVHEESPYGQSLVDASNGKIIFHQDASKDTGRGAAANIWAGNDGAEFWSSYTDGLLNGSGKKVAEKTNVAVNFFSYWDGDLERELLDGYAISKYNGKGVDRLLTASGCAQNNTTKANPCLSADIFGDWREELLMRTEDNTQIRIYCTPYETDYRITTLMHDPQYRNQVAGQNVGYNQPPHPSFYLGSDEDLPATPGVTVLGKGSYTPSVPTPVIPEAAQLEEGAIYMFKNVNSGLYLEVANGSAENGANVQQWGADGAGDHNTWRAVSAGDGYYYLISQLGDKNTYVLDVTGKKTANGTNMEIYTYNGNDAQKFKFTKNSDGSYVIRTKVTGDNSCVEVINAETGSGANIQQWETNGHACQNWIAEIVETVAETTTASTTTTAQTTTTTTTSKATTTTTAQPNVSSNYVHDFTLNGLNSNFYTISGNLSTSKGTVSYDGKTLTQCLKMESATSISFTAPSTGKLTLVFVEPSATIKVDGTKYTSSGDGIITVDLSAGEHTVTKADTANLFYMVYSASTGGTTATTATTTTTTTTTDSGEGIVYPVVTQNVKGADSVDITLSGSANAGINGVVGYWDNATEKWIDTMFEGTLDSNGKYTFNFEVPEGVEEIQIQIYWSGIWDNSISEIVDTEAEISEVKVNMASVATTTTTTTTTTAKTTTTTTTTNNSSSTPAVTKAGDANCDGIVSMADVITVLAHVSNSNNYPLSAQAIANADVKGNNDGLSADDAFVIQQVATGIIEL